MKRIVLFLLGVIMLVPFVSCGGLLNGLTFEEVGKGYVKYTVKKGFHLVSVTQKKNGEGEAVWNTIEPNVDVENESRDVYYSIADTNRTFSKLVVGAFKCPNGQYPVSYDFKINEGEEKIVLSEFGKGKDISVYSELYLPEKYAVLDSTITIVKSAVPSIANGWLKVSDVSIKTEGNDDPVDYYGMIVPNCTEGELESTLPLLQTKCSYQLKKEESGKYSVSIPTDYDDVRQFKGVAVFGWDGDKKHAATNYKFISTPIAVPSWLVGSWTGTGTSLSSVSIRAESGRLFLTCTGDLTATNKDLLAGDVVESANDEQNFRFNLKADPSFAGSYEFTKVSDESVTLKITFDDSVTPQQTIDLAPATT